VVGNKQTYFDTLVHVYSSYLVDDLEAEGDGLLAEDHLPGLGRRDDLSSVLVRRGANHHGLHVGVVDELRVQGRRGRTATQRRQKKQEQKYVRGGMGRPSLPGRGQGRLRVR